MKKILNLKDKELEDEILEVSDIQEIEKDKIILRKGQYISYIPIVIEGMIKVFIKNEQKEFFLYYIKPGESCILSFSTALKDRKSRIFAEVTEPSKILLLPVSELRKLVRKYISLIQWFNDLYFEKYIELIDTIEDTVFNKLDERIYHLLLKKSILKQQNPIKITHREIANDLGTAREVVTRVLKKLESENRIKIMEQGIKIFPSGDKSH